MVTTHLKLDYGMSLPAAGFGRLKWALGSVKNIAVNAAVGLVTEKRTLENIVSFEAMGNYLAHTYKIQLGDEPLAWVSEAENALEQEKYLAFKNDLKGVVLAGGNSYYQLIGSSLAPYLDFTPTEIRKISFKKLGLIGLGFGILGMSGCNFFQSEPESAPTVPVPLPTPDVAAIAGDAVYDGNVLTLSGKIQNLSSERDARNVQVELRVNGNGHQTYVIPSIPKNGFMGVSFASTEYKPGDEVALVAVLDRDPTPENNTADYKDLIKIVNNNTTPTSENKVTPNPEEATKAAPTSTPEATATPMPNNSYDFGKSLLSLEADYLKEVRFDEHAKGFISYLSTMPLQMRAIAERSGLVKKLDDKQSTSGVVDDKQITLDELEYFKRVMESYQKEIETMQPWLNQLPENQNMGDNVLTLEKVTAALALNLRNFREAGKDSDAMPLLLPQPLFEADGIERKYTSEIKFGDKWGGGILQYTSSMLKNITNFERIGAKALEVANNPNAKYSGKSIDEILFQGYFIGESGGSTDKGLNAHEDMKLLYEQGSFEAKAALRLYARNLTSDGSSGSAGQVRVELTIIDLWSLGIPSYEVVIDGHDVPAIKITDGDIALLKKRSSDPLLILDVGKDHYLPIQWTRRDRLRNDVEVMSVSSGTSGYHVKISDLKPY